MLIKTLAFHSISCIVSIACSLTAHQFGSGAAATFFQSDARAAAAMIPNQIAVRERKSDRLLAKQVKSPSSDRAPAQIPARIAPLRKFEADCRPPIDVRGRCFAGLGINHDVT